MITGRNQSSQILDYEEDNWEAVFSLGAECIDVAENVSKAIESELAVISVGCIALPGTKGIKHCAVAQDGTLWLEKPAFEMNIESDYIRMKRDQIQRELEQKVKKMKIQSFPEISVESALVVIPQDLGDASLMAAIGFLKKKGVSKIEVAKPFGSTERSNAVKKNTERIIVL